MTRFIIQITVSVGFFSIYLVANIPIRLENNDINNKSALVKHVYSENHHMDWNNSKILAKETDYIRRFLESFFIHFNNDAFDKTNCFYPTAYYN